LPPIRRNPPRDWAAPPPWASGGPASGQTGASRRGAGDATPNPPDFLAGRSDESRGLAGSAADRLVSGSATTGGAHPSEDQAPYDDHDDELAGLVVGRRPTDRPEPEYLPPSRGARRPTVSSTRNHQRERERDAIVGPAWERARRYEAYPTIRSRAGLPALPRLAVMAGALAIAAVAVFFLPALLGLGGDDPPGGSTAQPSASLASPSASLAPTQPPEPSAQVYLIKEGDTLSTVASSFGLTLEELLAANPDFAENPDQIQIGDEIIIPATPPSEFTDPSAEAS
jgi:LysM repeat protein